MAKLKNPAKRYHGHRKLVKYYKDRAVDTRDRLETTVRERDQEIQVLKVEIRGLEEEILLLNNYSHSLCAYPATGQHCICEHTKTIAGPSTAQDTARAEEAATESDCASVLGTGEKQRGELQGSSGVFKSNENASLVDVQRVSSTVDDGTPSAVGEDSAGYFGHRNIADSRQAYGAFSGYGDNDEDMSSESWSHVSSVASLDFEEEAEFVELPSDEEVDTELAV
ncbi:hypothetical protein LTR97_008295 [Elasticomyces elasticus]|uniref:Uncharacterized protein n=1 Tax=Elasticomyces elasticus TaxID=574655 RepID=A0AAN7W3K4_9PEZI|nr:hypothetical protein LTR97_008295 [Elasticomyces elasticus]KAK5719194.1 hypothetical protein LTR15_007717 [Elasticomyces elasticus]